MPDPIDEFFAALGRSGQVPLLARFTGSMRFELRENGETQRWRVGIDNGYVQVSRDGEGSVDAAISGERAPFVPIVRGRMRPLCAFLRNDIAVTGEFRMLLVLERLLPGPSGRDPRELVAGQRDRAPSGDGGRRDRAGSGRRR